MFAAPSAGQVTSLHMSCLHETVKFKRGKKFTFPSLFILKIRLNFIVVLWHWDLVLKLKTKNQMFKNRINRFCWLGRRVQEASVVSVDMVTSGDRNRRITGGFVCLNKWQEVQVWRDVAMESQTEERFNRGSTLSLAQRVAVAVLIRYGVINRPIRSRAETQELSNQRQINLTATSFFPCGWIWHGDDS